jgi:quercetin dioxygenase-like cupin family protein
LPAHRPRYVIGLLKTRNRDRDAGDAEANSIWMLNNWMRYLATGEDTGGRMALLEQRITPAGDTPRRVHQHEDEAVYVLAGRLRAVIGNETVTAGPGEFVFLPRGIAHSLHADSPEVRVLTVVSPAGFEQFFAAVGRPAASDDLPEPAAPDVPTLTQRATSYGVTIFPPEISPDY